MRRSSTLPEALFPEPTFLRRFVSAATRLTKEERRGGSRSFASTSGQGKTRGASADNSGGFVFPGNRDRARWSETRRRRTGRPCARKSRRRIPHAEDAVRRRTRQTRSP